MSYYKPDPYEELHKAWLNFLDVISKEFGIYKLLDWLVIILERKK